MKKLEKDKETAEEKRRISLETLGASEKRKSDPDESAEEKRCKKLRGGSDTVQFLKEHSEMEFTFKREELEAKKSEQSLLTEQQKQRTADDFQVAATTTTTEPTTTTTTTADAATTATDANYVYGIPEAGSTAYGHLISEKLMHNINRVHCYFAYNLQ